MNIELVVFDIAGTTVHDGDAVNACFRAALSSGGLEVKPAVVNAVMGLPKLEAIRRLIATSPKSAELHDRSEAIHADFVERMRQYYATDPSLREVPGAAATFAALHRAGIKVALNTGFDRAITAVVLKRLGWTGEGSPIDASVTSDEVPRGRPYPDMIRQLMRCFQIVDPRRVAKAGDTPADLEEGTNAGCGMVIGVTQGTHTREQLQPWPHSHLIETIAELPALLGLDD
jgi:phosphonatase-like hydrolase